MHKPTRLFLLCALFALSGVLAVACAEDSTSNGNTNNSGKPTGGSLFGDSTKGGSGGTNGVSSKGGSASVFAGSTKSSGSSSSGTVERGVTDTAGCTTACTKIIGCYGGFEETEQSDCVSGCLEAAVADELSCVLAADNTSEEACMTMFDTCFGYDSAEDLQAIDYDDGAVADSALCSAACTNLLSACADLFGAVDQSATTDCVAECADAAPYGEVFCIANAGASSCEYMLTACFGYEDSEFSEFESEFEDPDTSGSTSDSSGSTSDSSGSTSDSSGSTSDSSGAATGLTAAECDALCGKAVECGQAATLEECQPLCELLTSEDATCAAMHTCDELEAGACE